MDYSSVIQLISSVGFPITACIALFWLINKTLADVKTAVNNNTTAMTKLIETMRKEN